MRFLELANCLREQCFKCGNLMIIDYEGYVIGGINFVSCRKRLNLN